MVVEGAHRDHSGRVAATASIVVDFPTPGGPQTGRGSPACTATASALLPSRGPMVRE